MSNRYRFGITRRELSIIELTIQGLNLMEISEELGLLENSVRNRKSNIYKKLGVKTDVQMVIRAIKYGLVTLQLEDNIMEDKIIYCLDDDCLYHEIKHDSNCKLYADINECMFKDD